MAQPYGFEDLCWHDKALYGLRLDVGDCAQSEWQSDLVLDIDHIAAWLRGPDGQVRFRVAPATLTFHDVTDLKIEVDCGDSGGRVALTRSRPMKSPANGFRIRRSASIDRTIAGGLR